MEVLIINPRILWGSEIEYVKCSLHLSPWQCCMDEGLNCCDTQVRLEKPVGLEIKGQPQEGQEGELRAPSPSWKHCLKDLNSNDGKIVNLSWPLYF